MVATIAPERAAAMAGLRYVSDDEPGLRRVRCGKGFRYVDPSGRRASDRHRDRIAELVIPPAWTEVWICPHPDGHIQATGRDAAGRKVYRYHDAWRAARDAEKFAALHDFGRRLPKVRARVASDLGRRGLPRERVLALAVRLLDETLIRVGNPQYAARESYGLTTLRPCHVEASTRTVVFEFTGKHLVEHRVEVADPQLARLVAACDEVGGELLFSYDEDGQTRAITSDDVNEYLRDVAGPDTSARDFRTWGGTVTAVEALGGDAAAIAEDPDRAYLAAVDLAAERLGNTRDVCRTSYVHPIVRPSLDDGRLVESWQRSRATEQLRRGERATLKLLRPDAA